MKSILLIFDIDGTLTDSVAVHQTAFKQSLLDFGLTDFDTNWHNYTHHTDSFIFKTNFEKQFGREVLMEDIIVFERILSGLTLFLTQQQAIREIEGAGKMLRELRGHQQYKIVLATGSLLLPAKMKLSQSGIEIEDQLIIAANSLFTREELVLQAIERAKEYYAVDSFSNIISFGDGKWDLETAKNLGLAFVGIGNRDLLQYEVAHFYDNYSNWNCLDFHFKQTVPNFAITADATISNEFLNRKICDFRSALTYINQLPYRRNKNKSDLVTLFDDGYGTCSTKHALLRKLALENNFEPVKLMIGLFKMNAKNTPEVAGTLSHHQLNYIPEAHCYLKAAGEIIDITKPDSNPESFIDELIEEIEISPEQITDFKVDYHQRYLRDWLTENPQITHSFEALWTIREQCIADLDSNN